MKKKQTTNKAVNFCIIFVHLVHWVMPAQILVMSAQWFIAVLSGWTFYNLVPSAN